MACEGHQILKTPRLGTSTHGLHMHEKEMEEIQVKEIVRITGLEVGRMGKVVR